MKKLNLLTALLAWSYASPLILPLAHAEPANNYRSMKYGFFAHYVWGGDAYLATINKDGSMPAGIDDLANRFDAEGFARDMATMGVQYVLFTAWHADMNVLYPSKVMEKWRPGHSAKRDLIGDMIKACKAKGIAVLLYTHPRDGHDFTDADMAKTGWVRGEGSNPDFNRWDKQKWNDFMNEAYGELVDRYGKDILGLYLDEGSAAADSYRVVDYPRLRKTITEKHPHLLMMQNDYGNLYSGDIGNQEVFYNGAFGTPDGDQWSSNKIPISIVVGSIFWAAFPEGKTEPAQKSAKVGYYPFIPYTPEHMFRHTILQAGSNTDGGGVLWAAGPYAGGGWETGVLDRMKKVGALIKPIEKSIKNTYPSTSWRTTAGTRIANLSWGVATRSTDDKIEYLHILKPPVDGSLTLKLPAPTDGKKFSKALLLESGKPVSLTQSKDEMTLRLPVGTQWNQLNTVIALQVAPESPPQNFALWKGCRASSHSENSKHPAYATDGSTATSWSSQSEDMSPWLVADMGAPCSPQRLNLEGNFQAGDRVVVSETLDFRQKETLAQFDGKSSPSLEIVSASYGAKESRADLTEKLRQLAKDGYLRTTASNSLAGSDPAPNQPKELRIDYKLGKTISTKVYQENEIISLGGNTTWHIDVRAGVSARYFRVERSKAGTPFLVNEFQILGRIK